MSVCAFVCVRACVTVCVCVCLCECVCMYVCVCGCLDVLTNSQFIVMDYGWMFPREVEMMFD